MNEITPNNDSWDWGMPTRPKLPRSCLEKVLMERLARTIRAGLALDRLEKALRVAEASRLLSRAVREGDSFYIGLARAHLEGAGREDLIENEASALLAACGAFFEEGGDKSLVLTFGPPSGDLLSALVGYLRQPPDLHSTRALGVPHLALTPRLSAIPAPRLHLARAASC